MIEVSLDLDILKKNTYRKDQIIENLNLIKKISKNNKYLSVLYWVNAELDGYDDKEFRLRTSSTASMYFSNCSLGSPPASMLMSAIFFPSWEINAPSL